MSEGIRQLPLMTHEELNNCMTLDEAFAKLKDEVLQSYNQYKLQR